MIRCFTPDAVVAVKEGFEDRRVVEYLCAFVLSKHEFPLVLTCKAHSVLLKRFMTIRALDVMMLLLSSFEVYGTPCEKFRRC